MIKINNIEYNNNENETILDIARKNNIYIPTLCFLKNVNTSADCRMCLVEYNNNLYSSCNLQAKDGMEIFTDTKNVTDARTTILNLIVSNHHFDCNNCSREGKCELKTIMNKYDVQNSIYKGSKNNHEIDNNSPSVVKDFNKCILCKRCTKTCDDIQDIRAIEVSKRGFDSQISTTNNISLKDSNCTYCGQCINNCPTGALREKSSKEIVKEALSSDKITFVQTAPSIRVALGEEFGLPIGTNVTGKMVTALKHLGFDKVFDTNVGADFTIMEEATELINRIKNNKTLPMITSCSPAWVRMFEKNYPTLLEHISSCKSPHQMLGALIKTYYAETMNIQTSKIFNISIMPCTSKKVEIERPQNKVDDNSDIDAVLTTRELAKMIKEANIDFVNLEESMFDNPLGEATGAGAIFGSSGGVMEAALRTAKSLLGEKDSKIIFNEIRGEKGIKEATIKINENNYNIVVASGLRNAKKILEEIKNGQSKYHFIEIMACPGGCIMGGGQPIVNSEIKHNTDVRSLRANAMYQIDEKSQYRRSHENPILKKIYQDYLKTPGEGIAHKLLHTTYEKQEKYNFTK